MSNWCTESRDGTLVGYIFSKRYKKVSPHRKSHNLLYNLLREKNKPPQEMVNKRGVPIGPTWLTRTLEQTASSNSSQPIRSICFCLATRDWLLGDAFQAVGFSGAQLTVYLDFKHRSCGATVRLRIF